MVITFLSLKRFLTVLGHVTFLAALETGNLAYGSRSASHSRVYSSFPFALWVTFVTWVTQFSAVTTPVRRKDLCPVFLLLGRYSALPLGQSQLSCWNFGNYSFTLFSESDRRLVLEWSKCVNGQTNPLCPLSPLHCDLAMQLCETATPISEFLDPVHHLFVLILSGLKELTRFSI